MKKLIAVFLLLVMLSTTMLTSCSGVRGIIDKITGESEKKEEKEVIAAFGEFDEINTKNSCLGYGIDIIDSSSVTNQHIKMNYPIFDMDKLMNEQLLKRNDHYSLFETIEADSIRGFTENMSNSSSISAGSNIAAHGAVYGLTADASASFSNGLAKNFTKTSEAVESQYFLEIIAENLNYWLVLQTTEARYKEILSEEFKSDLYDTSITPAELFKKYGTHLLTSVAMGGSVSMYYSMYSYDRKVSTSDYAEVSSKVQSNVKTAYGKIASTEVGAQSSFEDTYTYNSTATAKNINVKSNMFVAGGDNLGIRDEQTLLDNYYEWQKSLDENPVVMGIKDSNSLYPIWKLIDTSVDGAEERYNELYNYFQEYGIASYDELCQTYNLKNTYTVTFNTGIHGVEIASLYDVKANTNISEYKPQISRDGYILEGWYKDVEHTEKFNFQSDTVLSTMTLYAKWKPILVTNVSIEFSTSNGNRDKYVTDDDGVFDLVSPNLNVASLIVSGYTKVSVEIVFDWKAYDLGTHRLWVSKDKSRSNAFHTFSYETGTFWGSESNWYSKITTFSVDLSQLNDDGSFYLEWGSEGNGSDNWSLGYTVVKITVI